jgi:hypothetical protein
MLVVNDWVTHGVELEVGVGGWGWDGVAFSDIFIFFVNFLLVVIIYILILYFIGKELII